MKEQQMLKELEVMHWFKSIEFVVFEYDNYFFSNTVFVPFVSNIYEQSWYNILLIFIFVGNHEHIINDCSFLWVSLCICCERMGFFLYTH